MEALKAQLKAMNIPVDNLDEHQLMAVAKALKLEVPRQVKVEEYTSKAGKKGLYVKTENYKLANGGTARGLWVQVEVIDKVIEDLFAAKDMLAQRK